MPAGGDRPDGGAENYITALQEGGRSANTIRQAKVVLGAMFGMAVADGYLDYNPFHDVKIPKVPSAAWPGCRVRNDGGSSGPYRDARRPCTPGKGFALLVIDDTARNASASKGLAFRTVPRPIRTGVVA